MSYTLSPTYKALFGKKNPQGASLKHLAHPKFHIVGDVPSPHHALLALLFIHRWKRLALLRELDDTRDVQAC